LEKIMKKTFLTLLIAFLAYSTTYSLEPVRCAVSYTGGGAVIVEVQLHDYGTSTNVYPGFGHKNIGLFTANANGVISFVIGSGDAAWTAISAASVTNNYMVNVYIGGAIAAYIRLDELVVEQGIYGSSIDASVISLPDGEIFVGDADGEAVSLAVSGDATMDNAGAVTVTGLQGRDVHTTVPTDGQVLAWDNTNSRWEPAAAGGAFSTTGNVTSNSIGTLATDDFVFGSDQLDDDGDTDHDSRMFFDKSKGAFRAGRATGSEWDETNIGSYSFVIGNDNTASGYASSVVGNDNIASGYASSVSGGFDNTANGYAGTVGGGRFNTASGSDATVGGGDANTANSTSSTVSGGYTNKASGHYSSVIGGRNNTAASYGETVTGFYSTEPGGTPHAVEITDRLFNVGNGFDDANRSDAFTILKSGNTTIGGSLKFNNNIPNTSITLPTGRGTNAQVLTTNGSGGTSWTTPAAGGGGTFTEVYQTVISWGGTSVFTYAGLANQYDDTNIDNESVQLIPAFNGQLKKIIVRSNTSSSFTARFYKNENTSAVESVTESVTAGSNTSFDFSSSTFIAGDILNFSVDPVNNITGKVIITFIIEYTP
jgi:hypothetical protein